MVKGIGGANNKIRWAINESVVVGGRKEVPGAQQRRAGVYVVVLQYMQCMDPREEGCFTCRNTTACSSPQKEKLLIQVPFYGVQYFQTKHKFGARKKSSVRLNCFAALPSKAKPFQHHEGSEWVVDEGARSYKYMLERQSKTLIPLFSSKPIRQFAVSVQFCHLNLVHSHPFSLA